VHLDVQATEHPIGDLADVMNQMMDQMAKRDYYQYSSRGAWEPDVNLYETESRYILCVDLAGVDREALGVRVEGGRLILRGTRGLPKLEEEAGSLSVHVMEIAWGSFHREVPLPDDADGEAIQARYREGFLWLVIGRGSGGSKRK
jgi:HSP20 family protein